MNFVCKSCHGQIGQGEKFCRWCGTPTNTQQNSSFEVNMNNFDSIYSLPEKQLVETFIDKEMLKVGIDKNSKLIPQEVLKRKIILKLIFIFLLFLYCSLIFFHFPIITYIIGLIILVIYFLCIRKFDIKKYLVKQLKARPREKITSIVMYTKNTLVLDSSRTIILIGIIFAVLLPLIIFWNPRIMYEKVEDGYAVRFYTFGVNNFTSVTIPSEYKNENVVSLRGNAFSNMYFLQEVNLPNTLKEIRGQAFKNDIFLENVKLPNNLEYLGGGAFYNCQSLKEIYIPDTVTYVGGEAFYQCSSLTNVRLSNNISEIRGNTFEECNSLISIEIPDSVTRIGGHAFYNCYSLKDVKINSTSQLKEIGSSAFRLCSRLYTITLPKNVYVNYRAFKESPTTINYYGINYGG